MTPRLFFFLLLLTAAVRSALHEPFPQGYLMGNLGTIICEDGPGGRAPLLSAAFMNDSPAVGLSAAVTTYYDDMDNFSDRHFATATGGIWFALKRLRLKGTFSLFDALGTYREQSGYFSGAVELPRDIRVSVDLSGVRSFLVAPGANTVTLGLGGISLFFPLKLVSFSATVDRIVLKSGGIDGGDPDLRIRCGIHTTRHAFGAQGVLVTINPAYEHPVSVAIGQEFRLSPVIAIHGAVANNPLFFGLGISVFPGSATASASLVNHPILGWSRGFSADYGWTPAVFKKINKR
jgi:hypothetical protein